MTSPLHSFQVTEAELQSGLDRYIDAFQNSLESHFLVLPRGEDFIAEGRFVSAYEVLYSRTSAFEQFTPDNLLLAITEDPLVLVVLRTILGVSPPELGQLIKELTDANISQGAMRQLDKRAREGKSLLTSVSRGRIVSILAAMVQLLSQNISSVGEAAIHRLDKIDTRLGLRSIQQLASSGVPYSSLLYERFLGRPFATHRDTVSELVGQLIEHAVETLLNDAKILYYKTGVAEKFEDMDQAPDFFIPDQLHPAVIIEAKLAEDDGTARDKVTRIQHLGELRDERLRKGDTAYELVACLDGRGFGIRREDIRKLLLATKGKLFTLQTMPFLVENTRLQAFKP